MDNGAPQQSRKRQLTSHSNEILREIEELHRMEEQKRTEKISTPEFHALADKVQDKSREIFRIAGEQREEGEEIATSGESIDQVDDQIESGQAG